MRISLFFAAQSLSAMFALSDTEPEKFWLSLRPKSAKPGEATFTRTARPNSKQKQALDYIDASKV